MFDDTSNTRRSETFPYPSLCESTTLVRPTIAVPWPVSTVSASVIPPSSSKAMSDASLNVEPGSRFIPTA